MDGVLFQTEQAGLNLFAGLQNISEKSYQIKQVTSY